MSWSVLARPARTGLVLGTTSSASLLGGWSLRRSAICDGVQQRAPERSHSTVSTADAWKGLTIYQYKICPFCNRVKSYLDYLKIDYTTIEVDPLLKSELAFSKEYKKVPVVKLGNGELVTDSGVIIDRITKEVAPERLSVISKTQKKDFNFLPSDTEQWLEWSEKKLAVKLYPNITRSLSESYECFGYVNEVDSWSLPRKLLIQSVGTAAMTLANGKIKKKYNIVDERQELKDVLNEWCTAVGTKKFLHGDSVTLPDIVVYGVLHSIDSTATFREIMADSEVLRAWYDRVSKHTEKESI